MYRQGDILLIKINELPELDDKIITSIEGKEYDNSIVLALGEATGHKHQILDPKEKAILRKAKNTSQYFLLVKKEVNFTHEEHAPIKIPTGDYLVIRQRQYTPERIIQVAD